MLYSSRRIVGNICWYASYSLLSKVFLQTISPSSFVRMTPPKHLLLYSLFFTRSVCSPTLFYSKLYLSSIFKFTYKINTSSIPSFLTSSWNYLLLSGRIDSINFLSRFKHLIFNKNLPDVDHRL